MKMKNFIDENFEKISMDILEAIRIQRNLKQSHLDDLKFAMKEIQEKYRNNECIPKSLCYCLQVLRDNILGEISINKTVKNDLIIEMSSYIDNAIEVLLLNEVVAKVSVNGDLCP